MSEHARRRCGRDERGERRRLPGLGGGRFSHPTEGGSNQDWWPNQLNLKILRKHPAVAEPPGRGLRLRRRVQLPRPRRADARRRRGHDDVAGLVARRLRPLRRAHYPHGVAQRGHLPDQRRPRRRGRGHAALRPPEQLAGQRQPGQGPPPALAGEEEVRPQDLVGRPDGLRGQPRAGDDGLHDLRLRGRTRRRLGARRGRLLGPGAHLARRRALHRRPRAREPARRRPDGPHLRQPRGPERQPGPARRGPRHPRDVRAAWR